MLKILSQKFSIPLDQVIAVIKQFVIYQPSMSIMTLDDLKKIDIKMEPRSIIIHFDMSGSMSRSGFVPLVQYYHKFMFEITSTRYYCFCLLIWWKYSRRCTQGSR